MCQATCSMLNMHYPLSGLIIKLSNKIDSIFISFLHMRKIRLAKIKSMEEPGLKPMLVWLQIVASLSQQNTDSDASG